MGNGISVTGDLCYTDGRQLMSRLSPRGGEAMTLYETFSVVIAVLTLIVSILGLLK